MPFEIQTLFRCDQCNAVVGNVGVIQARGFPSQVVVGFASAPGGWEVAADVVLCPQHARLVQPATVAPVPDAPGLHSVK